MKVHHVKTQHRSQMLDITDEVTQAVRESGVQEGQALIWVPHTTAGVTVNENADPDVVHDMLVALDKAVPWSQDFYRHNEGNSAAHVKSSMVGCSLMVPVHKGAMPLGTWQAIYFCEFDGPRSRQFFVSVRGV